MLKEEAKMLVEAVELAASGMDGGKGVVQAQVSQGGNSVDNLKFFSIFFMAFLGDICAGSLSIEVLHKHVTFKDQFNFWADNEVRQREG